MTAIHSIQLRRVQIKQARPANAIQIADASGTLDALPLPALFPTWFFQTV